VTFSPVFWYWFVGLAIGFLPLELYAAFSKRKLVRGGTFSEFVWWAFGIRRRSCACPCCESADPEDRCLGPRVRYAALRRAILTAFCLALSAHFILGISAVYVIVTGIPVAVVLVRAIGWER